MGELWWVSGWTLREDGSDYRNLCASVLSGSKIILIQQGIFSNLSITCYPLTEILSVAVRIKSKVLIITQKAVHGLTGPHLLLYCVYSCWSQSSLPSAVLRPASYLTSPAHCLCCALCQQDLPPSPSSSCICLLLHSPAPTLPPSVPTLLTMAFLNFFISSSSFLSFIKLVSAGDDVLLYLSFFLFLFPIRVKALEGWALTALITAASQAPGVLGSWCNFEWMKKIVFGVFGNGGKGSVRHV